MPEILVTGATSLIGREVSAKLPSYRLTHDACDLLNYEELRRVRWNGPYIVNCAFIGRYGQELPGMIGKNIQIMVNLRRRWPDAKLISFGSGAMFDKSGPIRQAREYDEASPKDSYGMAKRLLADVSDATLIPYGVWCNDRFVASVKNHVANGREVIIYQDMRFSWVNIDDLSGAVEWVKDKNGRFNLVGYDMSLTEVAKYLGATQIRYLNEGMGEYTGRKNEIPLSVWPKD